MPVLHNRISNEELKARMLAETEPRTTVSFYKYFTIEDPKTFRDQLYVSLVKLNVFGRIYVAHEGINAQISVPQSQFEAFKQQLFVSHPALDQIRLGKVKIHGVGTAQALKRPVTSNLKITISKPISALHHKK